MNADQAAAHAAHLVAAELIRLGIPAPDTEAKGLVVDEMHELRIFVSITRYAGPMRLHVLPTSPLAALPGAVVASLPQPLTPGPSPPLHVLSEIEAAIMGALSTAPVPVKTLQKKLRYTSYSYFAAAVRGLVNKGLVIRKGGGICRAK